MNRIVDQNNDPGDLDQLKKDLTAATAKPQSDKPKAPEGNKTPAADKYDGKSREDIIDMHRNAESELGRKGQEVGQYRQLTDKLLAMDKRTDDLRKGGADTADIEDEPLPEISSTDLLDKPTEAINRVVESRLTSDARKREQQEADEAALAAGQAFADKHPDAGEIAKTPEFIEWVKASPLRRRAAMQAYNKDFAAGTDLLDEYKASHQLADDDPSDDDVEENTDAELEAARKASTVSTGATQTGDAPKGKTYRRLDLIRLKLEDPEAYSDPVFQQEIMAAYSEGRVK
jgi:hypothetical protein